MIPSIGKAVDEEAAGAAFKITTGTNAALIFLAHSTKNGGKKDEKPFGSLVGTSQSRNIFRVDTEKDETGLTLALTDTKHKQAPQIAYRLTWDAPDESATAVTVTKADVEDVEDATKRQTVGQRIKVLLRGGAMTKDSIVESLTGDDETLTRDAIKKAITRGITKGCLSRCRTDATDYRCSGTNWRN